jgi:hypothetical protein
VHGVVFEPREPAGSSKYDKVLTRKRTGGGVARRGDPNDQRLTIYLPDGAVTGRVVRFTDTGVVAVVDAEVPRGDRLSFTLHTQGRVISGEVTSLGQEERTCRLQFAALTPGDRARLEPLIEEEG